MRVRLRSCRTEWRRMSRLKCCGKCRRMISFKEVPKIGLLSIPMRTYSRIRRDSERRFESRRRQMLKRSMRQRDENLKRRREKLQKRKVHLNLRRMGFS